ncbi:IS630 family transposase [Gloeothece verrucosa]|uniref:Transposase n=1 Tax=Gloeothece verrucosa (strain PCC 7822) TaxID=497965 RepID=E0UMJ6_GLOV7|nr:IS630 family transposase [Gloeothece verrucosa]ADN18176.1 transposase [Gloeothece verrucosa PCC 7822]
MPAKNHLSPEQKEKLLKTLKESENPYTRERILILLLMNDGKTYLEISKFLGIAYPTVAYWAVHGDPDNLDSLKDGRAEGNFRKATKIYEELLLKVVEKEPWEYGYEFGRWTARRLAEHLEKETGLKLSGSQVSRIFQKKNYVYIWAKYSLEDKQNPEKRKAFKEKLREYITIAKTSPEKLQLWFWDESGFSLRVIRRKGWGKKGTRKKVTGQRSRGRVNVMGGLRYTDKKRVNYFIKKGNADTFYESLKMLNELIKQEWVEQGNKVEEFEKRGQKILIILDNASFHKRKDILGKIEAELPNIRLEFLPAYSPDYNLIELVWHSAKEYIAHKTFESVEQLENLLNKLLNEGELIIKWERKLKNKGNAIY